MSETIRCGRCGVDNELSRLYCLKCGSKLDYASYMAQAGRRSGGGGVRALARVMLLLAMAALLGAILWPMSPAGLEGQPEDATLYHAKAQVLHTSLRLDGTADGRLAEHEINSHLDAVLDANPGATQARGLTLALRDINLDLCDDAFRLVVTASLGPARLTYTLDGDVTAGPEGSQVVIRRAWLGHLPAFGPVKDWVIRRVAEVFARMERERMLITRTAVDIDPDTVKMQTPTANGSEQP